MSEEVVAGGSKEKYLDKRRSQAAVVRSPQFVQLAQMYLSEVPLAGAAAFRTTKGEEVILINWDHYETGLGQNFTDCVPYEIEHEAQELWLTRGKNKVDAFGPDHYEAIRQAVTKAYIDGKLDRYMELKTTQMKTFEAMGDAHAIQELDFYKKVAEKLHN